MKISSRLWIIAAVVILLFVSILFFVFNLIYQSNLSIQKNAESQLLKEKILELNVLSKERRYDQNEGARRQFMTISNEIKDMSNIGIYDGKDEAAILEIISERNSEIMNLFRELQLEQSRELRLLIYDQIEIKIQQMILLELRLNQAIGLNVERTNKLSLYFLLSAVILSMLIMVFLVRKFVKSIEKPISYLEQATAELEKGNFSSRISINTNDELEVLADGFNKAMSALDNMSSEKAELENAKTEFLSITSHELRSPMTPMRAQLQMLKEGYFKDLNPKQYASVDIVLRNTERLDNIIQDLLEISRIEAARLRFTYVKANLNDNLRRLIEELSGLMIESRITIVPELKPLPSIECDPDRVMQVLRNLLENATKFSEKGNRIIVKSEVDGDYVKFSVKDFGIGISRENQEKLFQPFFQGEGTMYRKYGGTGLGLAISKGIVESQNGKIWVKSRLGKGSEFSFTVPLIPTKEIVAMAVLTSSERAVNVKLLKLFNKYFGPMAEKELELLKRDRIDYDSVLNYSDYIKKHQILDDKLMAEFIDDINFLFGKPSLRKGLRHEIARSFQKRENSRKVIQELIRVAYVLYGPLAVKRANSIKGVKVDENGRLKSLTISEKEAISLLLIDYVDLLGDLRRFNK